MKTRFKNPFYFFIFSTLLLFSACHSGQNNNSTIADTAGQKKAALPASGGNAYVNPANSRPTSTAKRTAGRSPNFKTTLPEDAAKFLLNSNEAWIYEIHLTQVAQVKTLNPNVKSFVASTIVADMDILSRLNAIAANGKLLLPTSLNTVHQKNVLDISKLSGSAFDREFVNSIISEREKSANSYKDAYKKLTPGNTKTFAGETLPKIEENIAAAKNVKGNIK